MPRQTVKLSTENAIIVENDWSKALLGDNEFVSSDLTASGSDTVLVEGEVMGQVAATGLVIPLVATATNGSQYPYGICARDQTIADGDTDPVKLVISGKYAEEKINFAGAETLATQVGLASDKKTIRQWLQLMGFVLRLGVENSVGDNS